MKALEYYFTPGSPWTYLGHERFAQIARRAGAQIRVRPADFGAIFAQSGGLPLGKRAPQRQAYRLAELARWQAHLGVPLNLQPKHFPADGLPAALLIIAAEAKGVDTQMKLAASIMHALWVEEKNIADEPTLAAIAGAQGLDARKLSAASEAAKAKYQAYTREAMERGVFGAPTYVYRDELFWGQDRLEFVERALSRA